MAILLSTKKAIAHQSKKLVKNIFPQGKFPLKDFLRKAARLFTKGFTAENFEMFYQRRIKGNFRLVGPTRLLHCKSKRNFRATASRLLH